MGVVRGKSVEIVSFITSPITFIRSLMSLEKKTQILREKNLSLSLKVESMLNLQNENNELLRMLDFKKHTSLLMKPAKVVNKGLQPNLLSIVIKMDSPAKLTLLVQSIISDPNTNTDTKKLISELLDSEGKLAEPSKWFAYLDLSYSQTENSNYDSVPVSKKRLVTDNLQPFATNKTIEYDKSYKRSSALTFGKNIDDTSSVFFNLGLDLNTLNKKEIGESDLINGSISYFKIIGDHYITPYVYYNRANYRGAADANMKGLGLNNTYILGEKNNINYRSK